MKPLLRITVWPQLIGFNSPFARQKSTIRREIDEEI